MIEAVYLCSIQERPKWELDRSGSGLLDYQLAHNPELAAKKKAKQIAASAAPARLAPQHGS